MGLQVIAQPAGVTDLSGRLLTTSDPSDPTAATAAANTAVATTYTGVAGQRHRLTYVAYSYNPAPTTGRLTVTDGGATIFDLDLPAAVDREIPLPPGGLQGSAGLDMVITLAAGGGTSVGKLNTSKYTV